MKLKRLFLGGLLFAFLTVQFIGAFTFLFTAKVHAVPANEVTISLSFTSAARIVATITYQGNDTQIIFRDGNPMDKTMRYEATGDNHCPGSLTILETDAVRNDDDFDHEPRIITATTQSGNPRAATDIDFRPDTNSTCQEIGGNGDDVEADVQNKEAGRAFYAYTSPDIIERVWDSGNYTFSRSPDNPEVFTRDADTGEAECRDFMRILGNGSSYQLYDIRGGGGGAGTPGPAMPTGCRYNTDNVTGSQSYNFGADGYNEADRHAFALSARPLVGLQNIDDDPSNDTGPPGTTGAGENQAASCESEGGPLAWIFCPLLDLIDKGIEKLDQVISNLLESPSSNMEDDGPLNNAWKVMRNIAYLILVPIMLVLVIGTALGFDFVSAYSVKRALPRLIAATLFIALSWELCVFLVTLTNNIGGGVQGLIESPFSSIPTSFADVLQPGGGSLLTIATVGIGVGAALILGPALIGILMLYGFSALMAILIGVFILTIRQVLILFLMLAAPLAILAWIFPGNDKLWKLWWGSFSKLLLMFPLIMGLISIGRVFAGITSSGESFDGLLAFSIALIAYIAPYFFIPATFKFAGGIFATIAGVANDRGRGLFDRSKKARQQLASDRHADNMAGKTGLARGRMGGAYRRAASLGRNGSWTPTRSGRTRWQEQEMKIAELTADKMNEEGGARAFNDDDASAVARQYGISGSQFLEQYQAMGHTREQAQSALHRAELATGAKMGSRGMAVAAQKFRVAHTNTAYEPGVAGLQQMQQELVDLQQRGLATEYDVAGWMKSNRGRADYSANGFVGTVEFAAGRATAADQLAGAFQGADPRDIVGGHQRAVESFAQQAQMNLSDSLASGDQTIIDKSMADVSNIYSTLSNISPNKAEEFANTVFGQSSGITLTRNARDANGRVVTREVTDAATGRTRQEPVTEEYVATVRQYLDSVRGDEYNHPAYHDRVREYGSARDQAAAAAAGEAVAPPPEG